MHTDANGLVTSTGYVDPMERIRPEKLNCVKFTECNTEASTNNKLRVKERKGRTGLKKEQEKEGGTVEHQLTGGKFINLFCNSVSLSSQSFLPIIPRET